LDPSVPRVLPNIRRPAGRLGFTVLGLLLGLGLAGELGSAVGPALAATASTAAPPKAWILVDVDRGVVLDASHQHDPLPVASAAKLMTVLLAVERLGPGSTVLVDAAAASRPPSKVGMKEGERWDRDQALRSALIVSANDAAYALGTAVGGSLAGFAQAADDESRRLGLTDSTWRDPAGLDGADGVGGGNLVSAFDLAVLARAVLANPVLAPIVDQKLAQFIGPDGQSHTLHQHNKLLDQYPGAIGVKTGYTTNAGQVLVAAARRGDRTLVAVTIGGSDLYGPASRLLDQGFASPIDSEGTGEHLPPPPTKVVSKADASGTLAGAASIAAAAGRGPWGSWQARLAAGLALTGATVAVLGFRLRRQHLRAAADHDHLPLWGTRD
jgi:serine-type D-Ala-D-Ala carboxypeptidase (penicillin-binding protein 5/6)